MSSQHTDGENKLESMINRDDEFATLESMINAIKDAEQAPTAKRVVNYCGASGMGKTYLLKNYFPRKLAARPDCRYFYFDASVQNERPFAKWLIALIEELREVDKNFQGLPHRNDLVQLSNGNTIYLENLAGKVARLCQNHLKNSNEVFILAIDEVTKSNVLFGELQSYFSEYLLLHNVLILVGSNVPLPPTYEVERRFKIIDLDLVKRNELNTTCFEEYFNQNQTGERIGSIHLNAILELLYKYTIGHPGAIVYLQKNYVNPDYTSVLHALIHKADQIREELGEYVYQLASKGIDIQETVSENELKNALLELSIYRYFHQNMLEPVLTTSPNLSVSQLFEAHKNNFEYFSNLYRTILQLNGIKYQTAYAGLVIDISYREIWQNVLKLQRGKAIASCYKTAINYYVENLKSRRIINSGTRWHYIFELYYHLGNAKSNSGIDLAALLIKRLKGYRESTDLLMDVIDKNIIYGWNVPNDKEDIPEDLLNIINS